MTYINITRTPGQGLADYTAVRSELGQEPIAGNLLHRVGVVDGVLVTVDEWTSRSDADRFAAERLFPAFERAGIRPERATEITAFETVTS
jgi:hypothetical protein